jgi:threonine dehydrogenase-like Zn-dependent dehydrogenase
MIVLPPSLDQVGVLLEPLTIAEKALIEIGDIEDRLPWLRPGAKPPHTGEVVKRAVVLGAGPVGLLGAMALLVRGYQTWVYSREPGDSFNAKWVDSVGARYVSSTDVPIPKVQDVVGNIDLVYEATGNAKVAFEALQTLGTNGVFIFTGVPGRTGPTEIDADLIMRNLVLKNQMVYGTVNAGRDAFEQAAADLTEFQRRWPTALPALITGKFRPEDCEKLLLEKSTGIKRVVTFTDAP